jgi:hypothetical protein
MPAMNCAAPPQNTAMPTTAFGVVMPRALALYRESIKVVDAKEKSPLKKAELALVEGRGHGDVQTTRIGDPGGAGVGVM